MDPFSGIPRTRETRIFSRDQEEEERRDTRFSSPPDLARYS